MTALATHPVDEPDLLALIADEQTVLGKPLADAFREACREESRAVGFWGGLEHGGFGWVNPNAVRARLLDLPSYEPRQYSALWSTACARGGYLTKTEKPVQISGEGSRGNGNKSVVWRMWIGVDA